MYQSIHFNGKELKIDGQYLRGQDILYRSPAYEGWDALPFGDGDTAYLAWNTRDSIVFQINKSDAVEFGPDGDFRAWSWESEEKNTAQVHCAKLRISDSMPSFDTLHLKKFEQRLNLAEGTVTLHSVTPFSAWDYSTFASLEGKVMIGKLRSRSDEDTERKIALEAWGSRSLFHFYEQIREEDGRRTAECRSGQKDGLAFVERRLSGTVVVTCMKAVGGEYEVHTPNGHAAELVFPKSRSLACTLAVAVVAGKSAEGLLEKAVSAIERALEDVAGAEEQNRSRWEQFWAKSFVHLQDAYLEALYHFHLYTLNCCARGRYPVNALGGAWTWNADVRNWGHFYHWNNQQVFWGLDEANHAELEERYFAFRFGMLGQAEADAETRFGVPGAFFSDICNLNGFQALEPDTVRNLTVGAQIAVSMYRHYQYGRDVGFLRDTAYPVMEACLGFYLALLQKEGGVYRVAGGSTPYESYWNLKESCTDRSMIRVLCESVLQARGVLGLKGTAPDEKQIADVLEHLFALPVTTAADKNGNTVTVLSAGTKWDGRPVGWSEGAYPRSPFPASQLAAIYPSGQIGLKDRGTPEFEAALHTVRILLDAELAQNGPMGCSGHTPLLQAAARLGMKAEVLPALRLFAQKYQRFSNGFMHYLDAGSEDFRGDYRARLLDGTEQTTEWEKVHEKEDGRRVSLPKREFVHMYYEPSSNFLCGIQEMLLQSYDGVIRVFPAVPEDYSAAFTLLASGNFLVTSEMEDGEIRYVAVKSRSGGRCSLQNPWGCEVRVTAGHKPALHTREADVVRFETEENHTYLVERVEYPIAQYYVDTLKAEAPADVRFLGSARLGKERMF